MSEAIGWLSYILHYDGKYAWFPSFYSKHWAFPPVRLFSLFIYVHLTVAFSCVYVLLYLFFVDNNVSLIGNVIRKCKTLSSTNYVVYRALYHLTPLMCNFVCFRLFVTGSCAWAALVTEAGRSVTTLMCVPAGRVSSTPLASTMTGVLTTWVRKPTAAMSIVSTLASNRKHITGLKNTLLTYFTLLYFTDPLWFELLVVVLLPWWIIGRNIMSW